MPKLERTFEDAEFQLVPRKRAAWGAIFGGVFVAIATMLVLGTLGVAIGATTIDPVTGDTPGASAFGIGAGIWWLVGGVLSLLAGGWVAGRLAGIRKRGEGALLGLVSWALTMVVMAVLTTTLLGAMVSGALRVVGAGITTLAQSAEAMGSAVVQAGGGADDESTVAWNRVWTEAQELLRQTDKPALAPENLEQQLGEAQQEAQQALSAPTSDQAQNELRAALIELREAGRQAVSAADKEAVVNVLVARTDMSQEQAQATVDRWANTFTNAWQNVKATTSEAMQSAQTAAKQAAEATANAVAEAAWWTFVYLLLTAAAAAGGAYLGSPRTQRAGETVS